MNKELPPAFGEEMNHDDGGVGSDTNHAKLVDAYSKGKSVRMRYIWESKWTELDRESSLEWFIQATRHLSLRPHVLQLRIWFCQFLHLWFRIKITLFPCKNALISQVPSPSDAHTSYY